ncbi:DNA-binding protein [Paraglaciecola aquimarina]|uniref:DNA-binding protein n=1 Tax=Paraglaciecola algarum TaxID=3050085 RepID=A0ABS9D6L2_9ALTE|nr:DNA-binding protein [Paraglaciecola sp. G1-23]MCF2948060.1 DNA-binding protein [Paraglaciecola sp. G1-23]
MNIKPIKNQQDYELAMVTIEKLWDARPGSAEADELDVLATLVESYEKKQFEIAAPDPVAAIKFRMEQQGLSDADLVSALGQRSRVSEILNKKRKLSISMIRNLHQQLQIPLESLISDYPLVK